MMQKLWLRGQRHRLYLESLYHLRRVSSLPELHVYFTHRSLPALSCDSKTSMTVFTQEVETYRKHTFPMK